MPVKSVGSHIIEPNRFVNPIDPSIYMQGVQYSEQLAKNQLQDISALHNSIFNIPTYGKDKEKLMELDANLKQQLQQLNLSNLGSMETSSQIKNLISSAANNPDVAGIAQRYGSYANELKKKEEAEAKGQRYTSPIVDQAEEYYGSGVYKTDKRFNQSGWISPDTTKAMQDAVKAVTRKTYNPKTGIVESIAKPEDVSSAFYEIMKNNPSYQKDLDYSFQKETKDVNWDDDGHNFIQQKANKLQQQYSYAVQIGDAESAQMAQTELNRLNTLSDPSLIGKQLKDQYFQSYINTQLEKVGYANDVSDFEKIERDPIDMKLLEHKLRMAEIGERELQKNQYKQAAAKSTDPLKRQMIMQAVNLGYTTELEDPTQPDGLISVSDLVKLGIAKPTEAKKEEEDKTKITVGDKQYSISDAKANIQSGSKSFIEQFVKDFFEDIEEINIEGDNVYYDRKGWKGNWTDWDKKLTKKDLLEKIGSQPTENTPDGKIDAGI